MDAIDPAALDELAEGLGDPADVLDVLEGYLELLPTRLDDLDRDDATRRRSAHTLKSGAQMLGAGRLARAAQRVEAGDDTAVAQVREEAGVAEVAWRRWVAEVADPLR